MFREMFKPCLGMDKNQLKNVMIIFTLYQVLVVDDDYQVIVEGFTFVKNINLVKLKMNFTKNELLDKSFLTISIFFKYFFHKF